MATNSKLVVAVDVDEVLAQFLEKLIVFHNTEYQTTLKLADFDSYHFCNVWGGTNEEAVAKVNKYFESPHFLELPPIPGSFEVLNDLKASGEYEFHVVTSRQTTLEPITRKWLDQHFPGVFTSVHHGNAYGDGVRREKSDICKMIGAVALIDDNWKYIQQVTEIGLIGVMFNMHDSYNWSRPSSIPDNCIVAYAWSDIRTALLGLRERVQSPIDNQRASTEAV